MNRAQKIEKIIDQCGDQVQVAEMVKRFIFFTTTQTHGWISISDEGDYWFILYTSGKDTHQPLTGPAYGANFQKDTGERFRGHFTGAWESALSMWPVRDEEKAVEVFDFVSSLIDKVFRFHIE